jgi:hypothetical protein
MVLDWAGRPVPMSNDQRSPPGRKTGEVYWAFHLNVQDAEFLNSSGQRLKLSESRPNNQPCKAEISGKLHLAIIVGPGDVGNSGYLVCYTSSHGTKPGDLIPRNRLPGISFTEGVETFLFEMVPTYCHETFFASTKPRKKLDPLEMEFVYGRLLWATRMNSTACQKETRCDDQLLHEVFKKLVRAWTHPDEQTSDVAAPPVIVEIVRGTDSAGFGPVLDDTFTEPGIAHEAADRK